MSAERSGRPAGRRRVEIAIVGSGRFAETRSRRLRAWLERVVEELAPGSAAFAVRFVGDRSMREWNRAYRAKDRSTDVLSFPGGTTLEGEFLGDVLISVPTARRQAALAGHAPATELRILLLHGILHCLGHDHEVDDGRMDRLERRLRRKYLAHA